LALNFSHRSRAARRGTTVELRLSLVSSASRSIRFSAEIYYPSDLWINRRAIRSREETKWAMTYLLSFSLLDRRSHLRTRRSGCRGRKIRRNSRRQLLGPRMSTRSVGSLLHGGRVREGLKRKISPTRSNFTARTCALRRESISASSAAPD